MKKKILSFILILCSFAIVKGQKFVNYTTDNGLPDNNVNGLAIDGDDNVWLATQMGVAKFNGDKDWEYFTEDDGILKNNVKAIAVNSDNGEVWIGTDYGACKFDGKEWTSYTKDDGLVNNRVNYIAFDKDGSVWLTTTSGVSHFDGKDWTNYTKDNGLPTNLLSFVTVDDKGVKWFGSTLEGIVMYDDKDFKHLTMDEYKFLSDNITSIIIDREGNKWIGSYGGLSLMNDKMEVTENYEYKTSDLFTEYVVDLAYDTKGNVWIGCYTDYLGEGGINMFDGKNWDTYSLDQNLVSNVVKRVAVDSKDIVWVATGNGLSKLDASNVGIEDQLESNNTLKMYPNPATDYLNVYNEDGNAQQIEIYNQAMQKVGNYFLSAGNKQITIYLNDFSAGIYFVRAGNQAKKLVITQR